MWDLCRFNDKNNKSIDDVIQNIKSAGLYWICTLATARDVENDERYIVGQ